MIETNKASLEKANAAITKGVKEGFLAYCTEDTRWLFVGQRVLESKQAVRQWMVTAYASPPNFKIDHFMAAGDFVTATGQICLKDENGETASYTIAMYGNFEIAKWLN